MNRYLVSLFSGALIGLLTGAPGCSGSSDKKFSSSDKQSSDSAKYTDDPGKSPPVQADEDSAVREVERRGPAKSQTENTTRSGPQRLSAPAFRQPLLENTCRLLSAVL